MASWNIISHMCKTRKFVMATLPWKQGLLCDKNGSLMHLQEVSIQVSLRTSHKMSWDYFLQVTFRHFEAPRQLFSKKGIVFTCQEYKSVENTMEKGEIARKE